jgi:hypothetical protein
MLRSPSIFISVLSIDVIGGRIIIEVVAVLGGWRLLDRRVGQGVGTFGGYSTG